MSTQIPGLFIMHSETKGRGVFTSNSIQKGDLVESTPVIVLTKEDREVLHETSLHDYYFLWGQAQKACAIALGYGSLYNHSRASNLEFTLVYGEDCIEFHASRDIEPGEELLINYASAEHKDYGIWFEEDSNAEKKR